MGDHRVSVDIRVTGFDGKVEKVDMWLNWSADVPSRVHHAMVKMAERAQLPVEPYFDAALNKESE
jgi:hypothetical protein